MKQAKDIYDWCVCAHTHCAELIAQCVSFSFPFPPPPFRYDPANPDCRFQCVLYGKRQGQDERPMPPNCNPRLWQQAERNNPDPEHFVCQHVVGFNGLKQRIELQEKARVKHREQLEAIQQHIVKMRQEHETMV